MKDFTTATVIIIIIISSFLICTKIFKLVKRRRSFVTDLPQWIGMCLCVTSICFALFYKFTYSRCACVSEGTWRVGAVSVFFGWVVLIIELKRFPITGIIINMLSSITVTFIKLIPVAALLTFTFALPFYMLLARPVSDLQLINKLL